MKRFLKFLILAPIAICLILVSVANRHLVQLSLDPLSAENPALAFELPVFVVVFLVFLLGMLVGGLLVWSSQGKHRRALREKDFEVNKMKRDIENQAAAIPKTEIAPGLPMVTRS